MKKIIILLLLPLLLSSCASKSFDTFFIHAALLESSQNGAKISVICEKSAAKDKEFLVLSQEGKTIEDATKALMQKNRECYFATCKVVMIKSREQESFLSQMAKELCDSNIFPTKSDIIAIENESFLSNVKNHDSIKQISELNKKDRTNTVSFFARFMSGKKLKLAKFQESSDGKIQLKESVVYNTKGGKQ